MNGLAFGSSFLLGAMDGLSPGHGKSLIAAFMVGERLQWRQVAAMGLSLLASHFLLLIVLALGLQFAFGDSLHVHALEWIGPATIILFGFYLLYRYRRVALSKHPEGCNCGHHQDRQKKPPKAQNETQSVARASVLGALLGLIPCPMALSTLFLSLGSDQFASALAVIGIYMIGMALTLFTIILLIHKSRSYIADRLESINTRIDMRLLSALFVIGIGIVYLMMNTLQPHSHTL